MFVFRKFQILWLTILLAVSCQIMIERCNNITSLCFGAPSALKSFSLLHRLDFPVQKPSLKSAASWFSEPVTQELIKIFSSQHIKGSERLFPSKSYLGGLVSYCFYLHPLIQQAQNSICFQILFGCTETPSQHPHFSMFDQTVWMWWCFGVIIRFLS